MVRGKQRILIFIALAMMVGCGQISGSPTSPTVSPTITLRPVGISTTKVPDVIATTRAYLEAWKRDDYATMYNLLTSISKDAISIEDFEKQYRTA